MARVLFTLTLLLAVFTSARVFGAPTQESESPKLNRQKRTFGFSLLDRDWDKFRRWPFIGTRPVHNMMNMEPIKSMTVKSMISMFDEDEHSKERLIRRLEALEKGQKQIIESISKKLQDTKSANQCRLSSDEKPVAEKQPEPVPTAVPQLDIRVQTEAAVPSTSQAPITTSEVKDEAESTTTGRITSAEFEDEVEPSSTVEITTKIKDNVEPSTTTTITSIEVEDKSEPSTTVKITSAEMEDKVEPSSSVEITKKIKDNVEPSTTTTITSVEVEDKVELSTTVKIASAEVEDKVEQLTTEFTLPVIPLASVPPAEVEEDKVEPTTKTLTAKDKLESLTPVDVDEKAKPLTRPQEATSSEESKEKVSIEKTEITVDAEVPGIAETAAESNKEAATQVEETNDVMI